MSVLRRLLQAFLLIATALLAPAAYAQATSALAIEYRHAGWDHYFLTVDPAEIALLDGGAYGGVWARTGKNFRVYTTPGSGTVPTCRFFSTSFAPKSSHFYTPFSSECMALQAGTTWAYEGVAFHLQLVDADSNCNNGMVPIYRLYNNGMGGAPNHRFTTDDNVVAAMLTAKWTLEGIGPTGAFACAPPTPAQPPVLPPAATTAEGLWVGSTSTGKSIVGLVLDTGVYYVLYTQPFSSTIAGVVQGTGVGLNGVMSSSNAKDFNLEGYGVLNAYVGGTYQPRAAMAGTLTSPLGAVSFSATYDPAYATPASLAAAAGTYTGTVASSAGIQAATFSVSANGSLTGSVPGCTFTGKATPHGKAQAFDLSVKFGGGRCTFGTSTLTGVAYYDAATRTIYAAAPNAARTDGFVVVGEK